MLKILQYIRKRNSIDMYNMKKYILKLSKKIK